MREIEFRVWDKEFEETLTQDEGTFQYRDRYDYWVTDLEDAMGNPERFTIMQYTGLKDRNGVEIYEGDIVQYFRNELAEIVFQNGGVDIRGLSSMDREPLQSRLGFIKVLGNIYENPELLEREVE